MPHVPYRDFPRCPAGTPDYGGNLATGLQQQRSCHDVTVVAASADLGSPAAGPRPPRLGWDWGLVRVGPLTGDGVEAGRSGVPRRNTGRTD